LFVCGALLATPADAITVQSRVTDQGGFFDYLFTVVNDDPIPELLSVTIDDAPLNDPLIAASLVAPSGYIASFDPGLGLIDLLADAAGFFPAGATAGFSFSSLSGPDQAFGSFSALDLNGNLTLGTVARDLDRFVPVPSPLALLGLGIGLIAVRRLRGFHPGNSNTSINFMQ
jgi:hypothetical protein